ncbi:MAG TPA: Si-specific NAD(P)(+) transhydrogenase [Acidiferrobacteraceae bacterium]|nr:Si-specific NAD(P)(+) transhydrogenase [Acidiferrobacteraceae bacterium]
MTQYDYDLVVIGGGPAGEKGAAQAAYFGHKVVVIEAYKELGGHCINWGTLASKTLRESALFLSGFRNRQLGEGLHVKFKADITLANFMHRTEVVQQREQARAIANLKAHGIDRVTGTARVADPHRVVISHYDGEEDITGKFILIATGSIPARPACIPFNDVSVFDSTTVLNMTHIPDAIAVIGGGVIGCEYSCLFEALGVEVHLIYSGRQLLDPLLDEEIGSIFNQRVESMGVNLHFNEQVDSCVVDGRMVTTTLKSGTQVKTDTVLYALGRSGNTQGLGLEALGISIGKYGHIDAVDPIEFQTQVPSIYAAGDVIGPPALVSTSMEQARLAVCHAFDMPYKTRLAPILPTGIYTIPEIAMVGETEQGCRDVGISYVVGRNRYGAQARGQIIGDTEGWIKLIFEAPSGKLLGVHIIGELASELIHVGMACLHYGGDIDFFIHSVFNYPTLGDGYKYAAYDALGKLNEMR